MAAQDRVVRCQSVHVLLPISSIRYVAPKLQICAAMSDCEGQFDLEEGLRWKQIAGDLCDVKVARNALPVVQATAEPIHTIHSGGYPKCACGV